MLCPPQRGDQASIPPRVHGGSAQPVEEGMAVAAKLTNPYLHGAATDSSAAAPFPNDRTLRSDRLAFTPVRFSVLLISEQTHHHRRTIAYVIVTPSLVR